MANVDPDAGEQCTGTPPSTSSVAVGKNVTIVPDGPFASTSMLTRPSMTGARTSTTLNAADPLLDANALPSLNAADIVCGPTPNDAAGTLTDASPAATAADAVKAPPSENCTNPDDTGTPALTV